MSTGRRLAKRSIIGTKVCAPGPDGLYYSGVIQDVKTPPTATITSTSINGETLVTETTTTTTIEDPGVTTESSSAVDPSGCDSGTTNITADTKYIVRFDFKTQSMQNLDPSMEARQRAVSMHISPAQTLRRNAMIKEFRESDLIGPGFRSIMGIQLQPGQRIFLTYNGRETSGDVISHDANKDEVIVKITAIGTEEPIELKKRLEEVRLLESRRSARLADQDRDTDFARLADMGGDRRRFTSHSIEVPMSPAPQHNPRKRPPSYAYDCNGDQCSEEDMTDMNACNAALILMNLSNSPKSPKNGEKWLGTSPGSSSGSWSSGSSSPPLSDDGHLIHNSVMTMNDASARIRTTSVSTSDEGIVVDFKDNGQRKKRVNNKTNKSRYKCTWKGCSFIEHTSIMMERHIREVHLRKKKPRRTAEDDGSYSESDHEEEFYYVTDDEGKASPPTLSHRDMARPPHEDPEYQRQIVGDFKQGRTLNQQYQSNSGSKSLYHSNGYASGNQQLQSTSVYMPTSPLAHHNYTWPSNTASSPEPHHNNNSNTTTTTTTQQQQHSPASFTKHSRFSPRPSQSTAPYPSPTHVHQHHHNYSSSPGANSNSSSSNSSNASNSIMHSNNSANNMLQQLSQQNVTVTAHHSAGNLTHQQQQQQQQQHHQLSTVTITPNYHPQQQHIRNGHQQAANTTASNIINNSHTTSHIQQQQHAVVQHAVSTAKHAPNSPNRRTRGENKKCRKVYGMERRDQWCTQCRWKKACSRFGD